MKRIALTGRMRSGKSAIAEYLHIYYGLTRLSFADELKGVADRLFRGSPIYDTETGHKPRRLYQDFGQAMRALDPDVWIRRVDSAMRAHEDFRSHKGVVIDDLRQPNEYDWARENGFTIIRVNANEDTRIDRSEQAGDVFTLDDLRHETELYIDDFEVDYDVWNDYSSYNWRPGLQGGVRREIDDIMEEIDG